MKSLFATALIALPQIASAQFLAGIGVDKPSVAVNEPVKIVVELSQHDKMWCGIRVHFGVNGEFEDIRVDRAQVTLTHVYATAGSFVLKVQGMIVLRGLMTALPCFGAARSVNLTVIDTAAEEQRKAAALAQQESEARALAQQQREQRDREDQIAAENLRRAAALASAAVSSPGPAAIKKSAVNSGQAPKPPKPATSGASKPPAPAASAPTGKPKDESRRVFGTPTR